MKGSVQKASKLEMKNFNTKKDYKAPDSFNPLGSKRIIQTMVFK